MAMKCENCGHDTPEGEKACQSCGIPLITTSSRMRRSHFALVVTGLAIVVVVILAGLAMYVNRSATLTVEIVNETNETVFFSLVVKGESNVSGYLLSHCGVWDEFEIQWLGFGDKRMEVTLWYGPLDAKQLQIRTVVLSDEQHNTAHFEIGA